MLKLLRVRSRYRHCCVSAIMRPPGYFISPHLALGAIWVFIHSTFLCDGFKHFSRCHWNEMSGWHFSAFAHLLIFHWIIVTLTLFIKNPTLHRLGLQWFFFFVQLGLSGLEIIKRGTVRIENNENLCFLKTIDWKRLGQVPTSSWTRLLLKVFFPGFARLRWTNRKHEIQICS